MRTGFVVFDQETGERLATLPLGVPIGSTLDAYENAGYFVTWSWTEYPEEGRA